MNLKRIIREEIKSLPSFGEEVCMIVHKSGDYILNYRNKPYLLTIDQVKEAITDPLYNPPFSSMYGKCDKMNEALTHYKQTRIAFPSFTDESVLDLDFNINDFEVVPYYNGLIPYTGNIFESQDDFGWIKDTNKWSYISDVVNQGISEFKGETLEYKMWFGELSYENHRDLRNFIKQNGWLPFPSADGVIIDSIYIDIRGTEPDGISFSYMGCSKTRDCNKIGGEYSISARKKRYDREFFDTHHSIAILDDHDINECEYHLNRIVKRLSILTEDGKLEPDMEWDFTKKELDKSKQWVQTKEDVKEYLKLLFQKVKDLPKTTKIKILKYVLVSFIGLVSLKELSTITNQVSPEKIDLALSGQINQEKTQIKIRKSSPELLNHLKWEEGSIREKGKPVLTAYDLGDGAYTIGYGHAVFKDPSRGDNGGKYDFLPKYNKIIPGKTKISPKQAEILLKDDIKIAEAGLNKILNDWENQGINPQINQKMYDSMISMIFNMGIGNFRKSEFIQMVKRGDFDSASQEIKNISSHMFRKYPGLKVRREKESELFSS